jgi:hypothetical protein
MRRIALSALEQQAVSDRIFLLNKNEFSCIMVPEGPKRGFFRPKKAQIKNVR